MRNACPVLLALLGLGGAASLASAYSVSPPKWPGSVKGTIRLQGDVPLLPPVALEKDPGTCGKEVAQDVLVPGANNTLAGALVWLEGVTAGKEMPRRQVTLDVRNCRVSPRVMGLGVGDEVSLGNVDQGFHQVLLLLADVDGALRSRQNLGMPVGGQRLKTRVTQPGWLVVQGQGLHPWMRSVARVFDHPYFGVTNSEGNFDLRDVPAGSYTLHIWHERLGEQVKPVEVKAGYPSRVDAEWPANPLPERHTVPIVVLPQP